MQASTEAARRQLIDNMTRQTDERTRVTGLLLKQIADIIAAPDPASDATTIEQCGDNRACRQSAADASLARYEAGTPAGEEIAKIARTTRDPMVYAAAMQACSRIGSVPAPPSCQLISSQRWTQLDVSNAVPWLHAAGEASLKKDAAGVADALYHVANAKTNRLYAGAVSQLVQPYLADTTGYERIDLDVFVIGVLAAWTLPSFQTVTSYCSASQLRDGNRWQTCDALTRQLIDNSTTLIEYRIGIRIAERLGWPAARLAELRQHADAMYQVTLGEINDPQPMSCRSLERSRRRWTRMAELGEQGAAREALASSGKSEVAWASERALAQRAYEAAASQPQRASSASTPPN